ncbi:hypothetical protein DUI87_08915 [Hirundo rustica rustica]|uniref:Reverse transcriptase domain-containing protein n=1 Tax=Hirundo rustica rustica TaxID=333673 RepID=A0A3M0KKR1_HIRRU|nr:hypothetical protein DUI87_08915 [Hirundo rustica rustica]
MSRQRPVMRSVPYGCVFGQVLFNISISDTDSGIKCTLDKFADDMKLSGAVDTTKGWNATQDDLDEFEKWAHERFMTFNKSKCKGLHLG